MADETKLTMVELATELTIAWLGNANNRASAEDVPAFLRSMHTTLGELASGETIPPSTSADAMIGDARHEPAVSVRKSLASRDHIVSMIDGKPYKTLRRHLATNGMTPEEYRARYNLKPDYPMTAPNYSEARRAMAKKIGLGRKPGAGRKKASPAKGE